ncbi:MAG: DUF6048 family protein [Paludibacter sp.]
MSTQLMQKISVYLSSLIFCILTVNVEAQKAKKTEKIDQTPLFNGLIIQADVASVIGSLLSTGETYSYEAGIQIDLKHKFFPVIEIGYAGANKTETNNLNFKTNGLYSRIGVDVNLLSPKKDEKPSTNLFLAGIRLGMSSFPYSVSNAVITDDYWGGSKSIIYSNLLSTKIWYEIVIGMRVELTKNVFMGWNVRNKTLLSQDATGAVAPWLIPGYGNNNSSNWGFNYVIGYKFQIPAKIKSIPLKL